MWDIAANTIDSVGSEIIYLYDFMYNPEVRVHLIDTPGFDDTSRLDRDILKDILHFMQELHIDNIQLSGIIYLHDLTVSVLN